MGGLRLDRWIYKPWIQRMAMATGAQITGWATPPVFHSPVLLPDERLF
jgi:hypothetical protein